MEKIGPLEKLGTIWWFELYDATPDSVSETETSLVAEMDRFEETYSRFIPSSEISKLNKNKTLLNPKTELLDMLRLAEQAYKETDGVFNIAVKKHLDSIGYNAKYSFVEQKDVAQVPDLTDVLKFNDEKVEILNDAEIDLGGLGKGYLIDLLAEKLVEELGCTEFLINGGGDMYATHHNGKPIQIGLKHPTEDELIGSTNLMNKGFAASSPSARQWTTKQGEARNHLVGNDKPSPTYITAPSTVEADIWATSLSIKPELKPPSTIGSYIFG